MTVGRSEPLVEAVLQWKILRSMAEMPAKTCSIGFYANQKMLKTHTANCSPQTTGAKPNCDKGKYFSCQYWDMQSIIILHFLPIKAQRRTAGKIIELLKLVLSTVLDYIYVNSILLDPTLPNISYYKKLRSIMAILVATLPVIVNCILTYYVKHSILSRRLVDKFQLIMTFGTYYRLSKFE